MGIRSSAVTTRRRRERSRRTAVSRIRPDRRSRTFKARTWPRSSGRKSCRFEHPDEVLRTVVSRKATASADEDRAERELLRLAGELRALDKQEARALDAHLRDIVSPAVLRAKVDELHKRRTVIEQRMVAVREDRARAARTEEDAVRLRTTLTVLAHRARTAGIQTKAEILRALVKRARVERTPIGVRVRVAYAFAAEPVVALRRTDIRADSTWQRALHVVVEETVPELRGRWAERRLVDSGA